MVVGRAPSLTERRPEVAGGPSQPRSKWQVSFAPFTCEADSLHYAVLKDIVTTLIIYRDPLRTLEADRMQTKLFSGTSGPGRGEFGRRCGGWLLIKSWPGSRLVNAYACSQRVLAASRCART